MKVRAVASSFLGLPFARSCGIGGVEVFGEREL